MLVVAIWIVEIVNFFLGHSLTKWGILPRSITGLIGIPLAPFIHAGFWHTVSNTIPIIILGGLTLASSEKRFWSSTIGAILFTGLFVWLFARSSYHVGASGLVFAYFGILMGRAFIERNIMSVIVAVVTLIIVLGDINGAGNKLSDIRWLPLIVMVAIALVRVMALLIIRAFLLRLRLKCM